MKPNFKFHIIKDKNIHGFFKRYFIRKVCLILYFSDLYFDFEYKTHDKIKITKYDLMILLLQEVGYDCTIETIKERCNLARVVAGFGDSDE